MPPYNDNGSEMNQLNSSMGNELNSTYLMAKRDPLYIVVPMTIMYSVIFVTGVIGNSITCMVITKHKYMHTATNYYLFSLAVSDLILLVSGLPQEMWSIWSRYPYVFGEIFCQLRGLFSEMSANATVLTITAFTAERYVAICHPFMAQSMSKLSRAVKLIVIIWIVAVLFAIPQALQFTVSPLDIPSRDMSCNIISVKLMDTDIELSTVSFTLSTVLFFVLPMTFITVLYALIGLRLRRSDKLKRTITVRSSKGEKKMSSPEYRANSSSKVLKMLVAVVVAFFICWAPFHAQRLIAIFGSSTFGPDTPLLHQLYTIATYVSGVLYYLSTTINPILYHIMSLKFRSAFKETMLRCCGGGGGGGVGGRCGRGGEHRGRSGGRRCRKRRRRQRLRDGSLSAAAAPDDRRLEYRRVSGWWTSSSVQLSAGGGGGGGGGVGHGVDRPPPTAWRRLAAGCWRRPRPSNGGRNAGRDDEDNSSGSDSSSSSSTGGGGGFRAGGMEENGYGRASIASPKPAAAAASAGRTQRTSVAPMALSNWTVISNSSLKDVDGDDLRDELVGYAAADCAPLSCRADTCTTTTTVDCCGSVEIFVAEEYY